MEHRNYVGFMDWNQKATFVGSIDMNAERNSLKLIIELKMLRLNIIFLVPSIQVLYAIILPGWCPPMPRNSYYNKDRLINAGIIAGIPFSKTSYFFSSFPNKTCNYVYLYPDTFVLGSIRPKTGEVCHQKLMGSYKSSKENSANGILIKTEAMNMLKVSNSCRNAVFEVVRVWELDYGFIIWSCYNTPFRTHDVACLIVVKTLEFKFDPKFTIKAKIMKEEVKGWLDDDTYKSITKWTLDNEFLPCKPSEDDCPTIHCLTNEESKAQPRVHQFHKDLETDWLSTYIVYSTIMCAVVINGLVVYRYDCITETRYESTKSFEFRTSVKFKFSRIL